MVQKLEFTEATTTDITKSWFRCSTVMCTVTSELKGVEAF